MLPLEIIRMKAKGCAVILYDNAPGFTLPSNIGELGTDIVRLDLSNCSLQGITCCVALRATRQKRIGKFSHVPRSRGVHRTHPGRASALEVR